MTTTTQSKRTGLRPVTRWSGIAAIAAAALFGAAAANAVAPAAGSKIGNVATASYLDPNGNTLTSTSNQVWTDVQQVGSFTLTADGAKTAAAGAVVYIPHTLSNTGNGTDTFTITVAETNAATTPDFTKVEVYLDSGSGLPTGSPLCTTTSAATPCTSTAQSVAGANAQLKFVIAYTVPGTATPVTWPSNAATVTVTAATTALYTTPTATNTDTVTLTTAASFSVNKSITLPSVNGPTAWPAPVTSGPRGTTTVYTLTYTNQGATSAPLYIKDQLPTGLTYVAGRAVWSNLAGIALTDADDGTQTGGTPETTIEYRMVGTTIEAWIQNVQPNVTGTLSFVVTASPTAAIGTSQSANVAKYNPAVCSTTPTSIATAITACTTLSSTGAATFTVTPSFDVVFNVQDTTNGTPNGASDTVTVATAAAGSSAKFTYTVHNNGNDVDTFDLTVPSNTFPTGTVFTWLDSSGATPLQDTNANGLVDTGPIPVGGQTTVVLQAQLPGTSAGFTGSTFVAVATSAGAVLNGINTEYDAVAGQLTTIIGALGDLQNNPTTAVAGDTGPGPTSAVTFTLPATNGTTAQFPLQVVSNDPSSLTYKLSSSQNATFPGSMPAGWTVTFSSTACVSPTPITQLTVAAGATFPFYACVVVPLSSPATTQPVYFQIQSTTVSTVSGAIVTDGLHDAVNVNVAALFTFNVSPSNNGSVAPAGTVTYAHNIVNTGNQTCGASGFTITATPTAAGLTAGWSTAMYLDVDNDGQLGSADTLITTGTLPALAAGASYKILVRVFAGGGSPVGDQQVVTVKVTDTTPSPNTCALVGSDATDTSTVVTGQIRVDKSQVADDNCDGAEAPLSATLAGTDIARKPGQCVIYRVRATNQGAAPVTNVQINDAIPAGTTYAGTTPAVTQPAVQCASSATGFTGTAVAFVTTGVPIATVSCGSASNQLQPGGSVTLQFSVQINQ